MYKESENTSIDRIITDTSKETTVICHLNSATDESTDEINSELPSNHPKMNQQNPSHEMTEATDPDSSSRYYKKDRLRTIHNMQLGLLTSYPQDYQIIT